jgi:hypothetical protein
MMLTKTETEARQKIAQELFDLTKKVGTYLMVGDTDGAERIQIQISALQQKHGYINARGKEKYNERTA